MDDDGRRILPAGRKPPQVIADQDRERRQKALELIGVAPKAAGVILRRRLTRSSGA